MGLTIQLGKNLVKCGNRFGSGEFANLIREFEQNTKAMEYNTQILKMQ